jgi:hypothetical protein
MTQQHEQTIGINVGLKPGADRGEIKHCLEELGAKEIRDPSPENPDLFRVRLPVSADRTAFIERAGNLDGVRYVEEDTYSFTS